MCVTKQDAKQVDFFACEKMLLLADILQIAAEHFSPRDEHDGSQPKPILPFPTHTNLVLSTYLAL